MTDKELEELKDKVKLNFYYDCFDYDGDEHTSLDLDGEYLISLIEAEQQRRVPSEDVQRAIATVKERWSETNGNKEYFEECGNQKEAVSACVKDMKDLDLAITALQQMQWWIPDKKGQLEK